MTPSPKWALGVLGLVTGCGQPYEVESRTSVRPKGYVVVVERQAYGGGPGSYYKRAWIKSGGHTRQVFDSRTLDPVRVQPRADGLQVAFVICRGRYFWTKPEFQLSPGETVKLTYHINEAC